MKDFSFLIRVKNRLEDLKIISKAVDEMPDNVCFSKKKRCEIHLILEELFTNIVNHGFSDKNEHEIEIELRCDNGETIIRMEDDGKPFNPNELSSPDTECAIEQRLVGGLGIHFVKHFIDTCSYERKNNKNIMILKKSLGDQDKSNQQPCGNKREQIRGANHGNNPGETKRD